MNKKLIIILISVVIITNGVFFLVLPSITGRVISDENKNKIDVVSVFGDGEQDFSNMKDMKCQENLNECLEKQKDKEKKVFKFAMKLS